MVRTSVMAIVLALLTSAPPVLAQDTDAGPPLGRLIDVGGRRLRLHCSGSAAPTVVIYRRARVLSRDPPLASAGRRRRRARCRQCRAQAATASLTGFPATEPTLAPAVSSEDHTRPSGRRENDRLRLGTSGARPDPMGLGF